MSESATREIRYRLASRPPRVSTRARSQRLFLIVLIILLFLLGMGMSVNALMSNGHWWGLDAKPTSSPSGAWQVTWSDRGLSSDHDIQVGDQILSVDGNPPLSEDEINQATQLVILPRGVAKAYTIQWQAPNPFLALCWLVSGGVSLVIGLLVFLHATDRALAWRFFLVWAALGIGFALVPAGALFGGLLAIHIAEILSVGLATGLMASFIWRLLYRTPNAHHLSRGDQFSSPKGAGWRLKFRWLPEVLIVSGLCWAALYAVAVSEREPDLLKQAVIFDAVQTLLALGFSLFCILRVALARRTSIARERARILLGGMLLGLIPPLTLTVIPQLLVDQQLVLGTISPLAIIILPLSFAYAILRHDLLRVDSLIRNTTLALITVIGMSLVAVVLAGALAHLPTLLALVLGIGAGAVLARFVLAGARWSTEAWLFPQVRVYRQLIAQGEGGEHTRLDPQRIAAQLVGEAHLALPSRHIQLFLLNKETGHFLPVVADADSPLQLDDTLYTALNTSLKSDKRRGPILVEPYSPDPSGFEKWPTGPLPHVSLAQGQIPTQENEFGVSTWQVLMPIGVHNVEAILALGKRDDELPYSQDDLRLIELLASRRTATLEFSLHYSELKLAYERRREYDQLQEFVLREAERQINQPFALIKQRMDDLVQIWMSASTRDQMQQAMRNLWEALGVYEQGLQQLHLELGQQVAAPVLERRIIEVNDIAQQVVWRLTPKAADRHIQIHHILSPGLEVLGDALALHQVLEQVLINALQASRQPGTVYLQGYRGTINRQALEQSLGQTIGLEGKEKVIPLIAGAREPHSEVLQVVELVIRDYGTPIPTRLQPFLFDLFASERPPKRTGLPLVGELIQAMHGNCWVESDQLENACIFHIVLLAAPLQQPVEGAAHLNGRHAAAAATSLE